MEHPDLIEGHARFSDAGVFRVRPDLALVQTVDFFPPLVDDPREFGRISAANSLSDCYAMGGSPLTALNIVGFPRRKLDISVLGEILAGGAEKAAEADCIIVGGHTVEDSEVKYGLAVTGTVHPDEVISNAGARPGDALVLTKPLGTGSVATGIKRNKVEDDLVDRAVASMTTLNRDASQRMRELGARGATDITGFGLLGHAREMAQSSEVTLRLEARAIPLFPGVIDLVRRGVFSGGAARNREFLADVVAWRDSCEPALETLLYDSETSGGLLIALEPAAADELIRRLEEDGHPSVCRVGEVSERGERPVEVV